MLHPDQTFTVDVDDGNEALPDDQHRRFNFRYGSAAQYMEIEDMLDDGKGLTTRKVNDALSRRLDDPADAERLAHDLTPTEQVAVLVQLDARQSLSEALAKKSKPLSPSSRASSAQDAAPKTETAAATS